MRIHTEATFQDILAAIGKAHAYGVRLSEHGSRTHARAFDIKLEGSSKRRPNGGTSRGQASDLGTDYAATWDEWGVFLAAIYAVDPTARSWAYRDAEDFHWQTFRRFANGEPSDAHGDHHFVWAGTPGKQQCDKCSARKRWHYHLAADVREQVTEDTTSLAESFRAVADLIESERPFAERVAPEYEGRSDVPARPAR
jgi:hypothetical protein